MTDLVVPAEAPEPCPVCEREWSFWDGWWYHAPTQDDDRCPFHVTLDHPQVPAYNRVVRQVRRAEELERGSVSLVPTAEYNSLRECMVAAADEVAALRAQVERLEETLLDVLNQACSTDGVECDSMALSAYCDGLELLAERGRFVIEASAGRRVIGKWVAVVPDAARATPEGGTDG